MGVTEGGQVRLGIAHIGRLCEGRSCGSGRRDELVPTEPLTEARAAVWGSGCSRPRRHHGGYTGELEDGGHSGRVSDLVGSGSGVGSPCPGWRSGVVEGVLARLGATQVGKRTPGGIPGQKAVRPWLGGRFLGGGNRCRGHHSGL